jgi:hypothetical protein
VRTRVCIGLAAVVVLAWLGVMLRDERLAERGAEALQPGTPPSALARAETDLRRAGLLNPDSEPEVDLALVHRMRGDDERGRAVIEDVVRREPENLVAWTVLGVLARDRDPAAYERALAAHRRLDPVNAARRARSAPR